MNSFGWLCAATALLAAVAGYFAAPLALAVGDERIAVSTLKFAFSVQEIRVTRGKPVTLVLTATDFIHGFAVPDFSVRTDMVPGRLAEVTFTRTAPAASFSSAIIFAAKATIA